MCVSKQQMRNTVGIQSNTSAFRLDSVVVGEKDGYQVLRSTTCSFLGYMMPWHTFTARSKTPPNSRKPFKATMRFYLCAVTAVCARSRRIQFRDARITHNHAPQAGMHGAQRQARKVAANCCRNNRRNTPRWVKFEQAKHEAYVPLSSKTRR